MYLSEVYCGFVGRYVTWESPLYRPLSLSVNLVFDNQIIVTELYPVDLTLESLPISNSSS